MLAAARAARCLVGPLLACLIFAAAAAEAVGQSPGRSELVKVEEGIEAEVLLSESGAAASLPAVRPPSQRGGPAGAGAAAARNSSLPCPRAAGGAHLGAAAAGPPQPGASFKVPEVLQCPCGTVYAPRQEIIYADGFIYCATAKGGTTTIEVLTQEVDGVNVRASSIFNEKKHTTKIQGEWTRKGKPCSTRPDCLRAVCELPSFTVVRNPWDRVISAYVDKVLESGTRREKFNVQNDLSFANFVRSWVRDGSVDTDVHTMRYSTRCNTAGPTAFGYTRVIALEDDLFTQLEGFFSTAGLPQWAEATRHAEPANVRASNDAQGGTAPALDKAGQASAREQAALARRTKYFLGSPGVDPSHPRELVDIVAETYADDIGPFGYTFEHYGPQADYAGRY